MSQRDAAFGLLRAAREKRRQTLRKLFELFDGNDAAAEIKRLKQQDEGF